MADTPRLSVRCVYPDLSSPPSEVSFRLSPSYGLFTAREAHDWFLEMMHAHEEFEGETDRAGESPLSFWSETVRGVMVESFAACISGYSSALCHVGLISARLGRSLEFDGDAEKFVGDDEANTLLTRNYRPPYVVPSIKV